jgi:hypothetical protein
MAANEFKREPVDDGQGYRPEVHFGVAVVSFE